MSSNQEKHIDLQPVKPTDQEIISVEECQQYIGQFGLTDQRITQIRNNLVGIIDNIVNSYLESFE